DFDGGKHASVIWQHLGRPNLRRIESPDPLFIREAAGSDVNHVSLSNESGPASPGPIRFTLLLGGDLLLAGYRPFGTLARPRVGLRALAAHGKPAPMTHAAVAADLHQPLDVSLNFAPKVPFDAQRQRVDRIAELL